MITVMLKLLTILYSTLFGVLVGEEEVWSTGTDDGAEVGLAVGVPGVIVGLCVGIGVGAFVGAGPIHPPLRQFV